MDTETLFVATKWNILKLLSGTPLSPLQPSEKRGTTIANISAQLKLLEVANFVKKERTGSAKAGKPRYLFSLTKDYAFITSVANNLAFKELLAVQPHQKTTLAIWTLQKQYHAPLTKFLYLHEELLNKDVYISTDGSSATMHIISEKKKKKKKTETETVTYNDNTYTITLSHNPAYRPQTGHKQICFGGSS
jgi:hypothetical protein